MVLLKDSSGIVFSADLLLIAFLLVLVLGIVANIIDSSNDKIVNQLEVAELERLTNEVVENLINNPGTPRHWEELLSFNGIIPGLAIENNVNKTIINTVSYKKIKILENGWYESLVNKKMFSEEIKSSISIYPVDCNIGPFFIGDDISSSNFNMSNIVTVNRTVKCDFYRDLAIFSVFGGNKLSKSNIFYNNDNLPNNKNICNHETLTNLNHSDVGDYNWICKEFKITKKNFEENNYYLLFNDNSTNNADYWILDDIKNVSTSENFINNEKINLNDKFNINFENESSMIFYIHFKINKNNLNKFNAVLIETPKDMNIDDLNIDYFKEQNCYFIMRSCYG